MRSIYIILLLCLTLISPASAASASADVLTIANADEGDAAHLAFMEAYPDTSLAFADAYVSDEQILQHLMTKSDEVDVYFLDVNGGGYDALYARGFLGDMSALSPYVQGMLPQVKARVHDAQGRLVALPVAATAYAGYTYDPETLSRINASADALPVSWPEFLAFVDDWYRTQAPAYPEVSLFEPDQVEFLKQALFYAMYNDYSTYLDQLDGMPSFDTPLFRELLDAFESVAFDDIVAEYGDGAAWGVEYVLLGYGEEIGFVEERESTNVPLPLMLGSSTGPFYGMTLRVGFINPYSKHQTAALNYLTAMADEMPPTPGSPWLRRRPCR